MHRNPRRPLRAISRFLAPSLLLLILFGCGRATPTVETPPATPWNVVILMIDTLRADRLDLYGYARPTTPHLKALARSGVVLRDARSQAGCTYPSVSSFMTSRWPQHFINRQDTYGMAIPEDTPALAEILRGHGYSTAAVSSSVVVRKTPTKVNRQGGYGRGFQTFDESCQERAADCVNARAGALLAQLSPPFLLYLHYLDPHQPYQPPPTHPRRLSAATAANGRAWAQRGDPRRVIRRLYEQRVRSAVDPGDAATLSALYDEEIAYLDERLGELMQRLEDSALLERTIVVLLADHGEELLDHGEWGHCRNLAFETVLHTPLVLWIPDGPRGVERTGPAGNLDVVPTLLDLLKLPYDAQAFAGTSLRPLIENRDAPGGGAVSYGLQGTSRVATDGRYKVWLDLAGGAPRVFDLRIGEDTPAADYDRRAVNRLAAALRAWVEREEGSKRDANIRRAREHEAQLRALGYL